MLVLLAGLVAADTTFTLARDGGAPLVGSLIYGLVAGLLVLIAGWAVAQPRPRRKILALMPDWAEWLLGTKEGHERTYQRYWRDKREAYAGTSLGPFCDHVRAAYKVFVEKEEPSLGIMAGTWEEMVDKAGRFPRVAPGHSMKWWRRDNAGKLGDADIRLLDFCETIYPPTHTPIHPPSERSVLSSENYRDLDKHWLAIIRFLDDCGEELRGQDGERFRTMLRSPRFESEKRIAKLALYMNVAKAAHMPEQVSANYGLHALAEFYETQS